MKEQIIYASIESLRKEGLKFSVDTLANKLKISKKTIYKIFPDKEALALALYERYYADAKEKAQALADSNDSSARYELLSLYFDSKIMIRKDVFNKYKLNESIHSYTTKQNDALWKIISGILGERTSEQEKETIRMIVDGTFEKLCNEQFEPDAVIERLVQLL